jgi:hypothetical protein
LEELTLIWEHLTAVVIRAGVGSLAEAIHVELAIRLVEEIVCLQSKLVIAWMLLRALTLFDSSLG